MPFHCKAQKYFVVLLKFNSPHIFSNLNSLSPNRWWLPNLHWMPWETTHPCLLTCGHCCCCKVNADEEYEIKCQLQVKNILPIVPKSFKYITQMPGVFSSLQGETTRCAPIFPFLGFYHNLSASFQSAILPTYTKAYDTSHHLDIPCTFHFMIEALVAQGVFKPKNLDSTFRFNIDTDPIVSTVWGSYPFASTVPCL